MITKNKGKMAIPHSVEVTAIGCEGGLLDETLRRLTADSWSVRQVFQETPMNYRQIYQEMPAPAYYRVFAQREIPLEDTGACAAH
jgi:hypothetical protein